MFPTPFAHTPSFVGSHTTGWDNMFEGMVRNFTLHFVVQTDKKAEQFIRIDIDKTHEMLDRFLGSADNPPEDLEEFIDPLEPDMLESCSIGTPRYSYRRKTDVSVFMEEINKHHVEEHPVQRFMDDWNRSSAQQKAVLSDDWIVRPLRNTGRFGEQIINSNAWLRPC